MSAQTPLLFPLEALPCIYTCSNANAVKKSIKCSDSPSLVCGNPAKQRSACQSCPAHRRGSQAWDGNWRVRTCAVAFSLAAAPMTTWRREGNEAVHCDQTLRTPALSQRVSVNILWQDKLHWHLAYRSSLFCLCLFLCDMLMFYDDINMRAHHDADEYHKVHFTKQFKIKSESVVLVTRVMRLKVKRGHMRFLSLYI